MWCNYDLVLWVFHFGYQLRICSYRGQESRFAWSSPHSQVYIRHKSNQLGRPQDTSYYLYDVHTNKFSSLEQRTLINKKLHLHICNVDIWAWQCNEGKFRWRWQNFWWFISQIFLLAKVNVAWSWLNVSPW